MAAKPDIQPLYILNVRSILDRSFLLLILALFNSIGCGEQAIPNQNNNADDLNAINSEFTTQSSATPTPSVIDTTLVPIVDPGVGITSEPLPTTVPTATILEPSVGEQTTDEPQKNTPQPPGPIRCLDVNYCLNGGTCVLAALGQMVCLCPEGFYGARCQTRNICQTIITASLTGDQICDKIDRECYKNDKFFRCSCHDGEYFLFKTNQPQFIPNREQSEEISENSNKAQTNYLAECRKIDKCLGIRCRRMSEVCSEGKCICNNDSGYLKDPKSGKCKLLNPCLMPTEDGSAICGQAQCVATYDHELYRCVCPVGYKALKVGAHRNSTKCVPVSFFTICDVPFLNKCQHNCTIDRAQFHYKCSCLPGYRAGTREIDNHLCFFDEHVGQYSYNDPPYGREGASSHNPSTGPSSNFDHRPSQDYVYKSYFRLKNSRHTKGQELSDKIHDYNNLTYDPLTTINPGENNDDEVKEESEHELGGGEELKSSEIYIKRELRSAHDPTRAGDEEGGSNSGLNINRMSAQERCNMYCEENKICVLQEGFTDSYRCVCDRQGYISIGDRCLDWCAAAEFSYRVRGLLDAVCLSGACESSSQNPADSPDSEIAKLERESSWRPSYECDCTSSPLLIKDPETKLCKLDFQAILAPCLPGNVGYIDCVENKNAYCAVLYKPFWSFIKDLQKERPTESAIKPSDPPDSSSNGSDRPKFKANDKLYTCVCSPEKKFLVDKPRNKARCVDECDLLNVECGRFNRMCRAATIAPDDFGSHSLVRMDPDGVRMNFKRTGCECLPGFNVGPSESVDFTLDDNNPSLGALSVNPFSSDTYLQVAPIVQNSNEQSEETEHYRTKYMNINSRCHLDYDVVEFHAKFKAPADFDPTWVKIRNPNKQIPSSHPEQVASNPKHTNLNQLNPNSNNFEDKSSLSSYGSTNKLSAVSSTTKGHLRNSIQGNLTLEAGSDIILEIPQFMKTDISEFHKSIVLVAQCDDALAQSSLEAYQECIKYRYWIVQKLRQHFVDWRRVITAHLSETFDLMEGNIRLHVNKCQATLISASVDLQKDTQPKHPKDSSSSLSEDYAQFEDPNDEQALIDADIDCELTLHSASDDSSPKYSRKVLLEKQLQKFIFMTPANSLKDHYYLMAPKTLIRRESFDQLAEHRQLFNPCKSDYAYCDKQTKCEMVDTVNFTCTCEYGYTPIGSRDIYYGDSRMEVCEDINECLFDVCKELANVSTCINEIGDYRCQCNRHYTGDNKRFCTHVCNTIPCKYGRCRLVDDHHAFCECEDGYKETDCSVQDPNVALRKANMIICGSIFTSVLLLAVTLAISLSHQLKKTKKKLKKMESFNDAGRMTEFTHQQPFRSRISSKVS